MITELSKVNKQKWNIIFSIFSYMGANWSDFNEFKDLEKEFEKRVGKIEWQDDENYTNYIPEDIFLKFKKIAKQILKEEWNEYSIITPFSLGELAEVFNLK